MQTEFRALAEAFDEGEIVYAVIGLLALFANSAVKVLFFLP